MKFQGSRIIHINCCECNKDSPALRAYLYEDNDGLQWDAKDIPKNWQVEDEAELYDGLVVGYCPEHSER